MRAFSSLAQTSRRTSSSLAMPPRQNAGRKRLINFRTIPQGLSDQLGIGLLTFAFHLGCVVLMERTSIARVLQICLAWRRFLTSLVLLCAVQGLSGADSPPGWVIQISLDSPDINPPAVQ